MYSGLLSDDDNMLFGQRMFLACGQLQENKLNDVVSCTILLGFPGNRV